MDKIPEPTEMHLDLILKKPQAIEIIKKIPRENLNETIEKYIIIGDMVISHASVVTSKESIASFFGPLTDDIERIQTQLYELMPTLAKATKKGAISVEHI